MEVNNQQCTCGLCQPNWQTLDYDANFPVPAREPEKPAEIKTAHIKKIAERTFILAPAVN